MLQLRYLLSTIPPLLATTHSLQMGSMQLCGANTYKTPYYIPGDECVSCVEAKTRKAREESAAKEAQRAGEKKIEREQMVGRF